MIQQPPLLVGANGSSFLSMGPHTEGTKGSFVSLQNAIKLDHFFYLVAHSLSFSLFIKKIKKYKTL